MTNMKAVDDMILNLMDTGTPVLFVSLDDDECHCVVNHVVIPDEKNKTIVFDYDNAGFLYRVKSYDIPFEEIIVDFSKKVMYEPGAYLQLYGM